MRDLSRSVGVCTKTSVFNENSVKKKASFRSSQIHDDDPQELESVSLLLFKVVVPSHL